MDSGAGAANSGAGTVALPRAPAPVADKVADNGGEPGEGTAAEAPLRSLRSRLGGEPTPPQPQTPPLEPGEGTAADGGKFSVEQLAAADKVADNGLGGEPAATATSAGRSLRSRGEQAAADNVS